MQKGYWVKVFEEATRILLDARQAGRTLTANEAVTEARQKVDAEAGFQLTN